MKLLEYATFEQMHGRKSTLPELAGRLRQFSRSSVLYTCALTGIALKLWEGGEIDLSTYDLFISTTFDQLRGDWYRLSVRSDKPEVVVHRRQLLLVMKLALESCPLQGEDLVRAEPGYFGTILLMASDHFHHGLYPFPAIADERDKVSRVLAEFVPITEYGPSRFETLVARSHLMMTKYTDALSTHPDFISIAATYQHITGIPLLVHESLTFGLFTRCTQMVSLKDLQQNPWLAVVREHDFYRTSITREAIHAFFTEFGATASEMLLEINNARRRKQDYGPNDFTIFRRKPIIIEAYGMLPTDVILMLQKFESGPYWRINNLDRKTGDKLRRFWGAVFERYANDQVAAGAGAIGAGSNTKFVSDPRWAADPSQQLCDALLVEGDALVLLEYKSSMFTAEAKYSGNYEVLRDEIVKKLVRNEEREKRKGVEQLAYAVKRLLSGEMAAAVQGLRLNHVTRVYPLLVTLDDVGGTLLITRLLNGYFREFLDGFSDQRLRPLFCMNIASLETVLPSSDVHPISSLLQYWLSKDPTLMATLLAHLPDDFRASRNDILYEAWQILGKDMTSQLFPEASTSHGAPENP